jgi:hypothetical protein
MTYLFPSMVALTSDGQVLRSGSGQVFAQADTSYTTPLTIHDLAGVAHTSVAVDYLGLTQAFRSDQPIVVWKSGDSALVIWSAGALQEAADAAATAAAASQVAAVAAAAAAAASGTLDPEVIQDAVAAMLVAGAHLGVTYDDVAGTITLAVTSLTATDVGADASGAAAAAQAAAVQRANHTGTQAAATISDSTTVGRSILTAADAAAVRTAAGAAPVVASVMYAYKAGTWPARPTSSATTMVIWIGPGDPPTIVTSGTGGMRDDLDLCVTTAA